MDKKIGRQRKAIKELAHILTNSEFYSVTLSSRLETIHRGECVSFPGVMIEQTLSGRADVRTFGAKRTVKKERAEISDLIREAELPVDRNHLRKGGGIRIMSAENAVVNELIGAIKAELDRIEPKAAKKTNRC